jgi:cytochrome c biogenesis protein CcmG/thiol:disulfide interchange protein DsbE
VGRGATAWGALLVLTLPSASCGSRDPPVGPSVADQQAALVGAPRPLARLHAQASRLLGGGRDAFRQRVAGLRGYPVVINIWGAWCPPCRTELPYFQRQALTLGKRIAFLGVDSNNDLEEAATELLEKVPLSYPSYTDPTTAIASEGFHAVGFPATVFLDRRGNVSYLKAGAYADERALAADIRRYAR